MWLDSVHVADVTTFEVARARRRFEPDCQPARARRLVTTGVLVTSGFLVTVALRPTWSRSI